MTPAADAGPPPSTMRRDVLSAYAASAAKVLSWVIVSAILFRADHVQYALLALIRGTVGLLNYTTLGLAPAMIRLLADAQRRPEAARAMGELPPTVPATTVLDYASPPAATTALIIYVNGRLVALLCGLIGIGLSVVYAAFFRHLHDVPPLLQPAGTVVLAIGIGTVLRLASEAPAAVLQTSGAIGTDNLFVTASEVAWVLAVWSGTSMEENFDLLWVSAMGYALSGGLLLALRRSAADRYLPSLGQSTTLIDRRMSWRLVATGGLVALAQVADFLYAPTDYILINRLISVGAVASYAPAVQIDAGLLLLVSALATVLLPKAAIAHAAGETARLRTYYLRGTLASAALLLAAGIAAYFLSPWIFRVWLGDSLPQTQAILPLVLVHTVAGGSASVGRAILLGMGKVKPFAIAALVAGAANVVLSYVFVKHFGLGLNGIVYGTIVAVVGRAVVWQPWYVLRTLKREAGKAFEPAGAVAAAPPEPL